MIVRVETLLFVAMDEKGRKHHGIARCLDRKLLPLKKLVSHLGLLLNVNY